MTKDFKATGAKARVLCIVDAKGNDIFIIIMSDVILAVSINFSDAKFLLRENCCDTCIIIDHYILRRHHFGSIVG